MLCPSIAICDVVMVESLAGNEDGCEIEASRGGEDVDVSAEIADDIDCASITELADGTGDSVLRIEDGPTGILPIAPTSCSSGRSLPPCWLASVELENGEAILTCVYYVLDETKRKSDCIAHLLDRWLQLLLKEGNMGQPKKSEERNFERNGCRSNEYGTKRNQAADGVGEIAGLGLNVMVTESVTVDREGITWSVRNVEEVFMHVSSAAQA